MPNQAEAVLKLNDLFQVSGWQHRIPWKPFKKQVEIYRLYGDGETGPTAALLRFQAGGAAVDLEVWAVPPAGLAAILLSEPPGLSIGKVKLADGSEVLGVLGEPILCEDQKEITQYGGGRGYLHWKGTGS